MKFLVQVKCVLECSAVSSCRGKPCFYMFNKKGCHFGRPGGCACRLSGSWVYWGKVSQTSIGPKTGKLGDTLWYSNMALENPPSKMIHYDIL